MIDIKDRSSGRVLGLEIVGKVHTQELREAQRRLEAIIERYGRARVLVKLEKVPGFEPAALVERIKFGIKHYRDVERIAIVSDAGWLPAYVKTMQRLVPFVKLELFARTELERAWEWLERDVEREVGAHP